MVSTVTGDSFSFFAIGIFALQERVLPVVIGLVVSSLKKDVCLPRYRRFRWDGITTDECSSVVFTFFAVAEPKEIEALSLLLERCDEMIDWFCFR